MMLLLVTTIALMGFTFMQVTMIVRRVDMALYSMVPGVFEAGVDTEYVITHGVVVFDQEVLHQSVTTYLASHFTNVPFSYEWELMFEDAATRSPCTTLCDGVVFHFSAALLEVYSFERTLEVFVIDHENNHN